MCVKTQIRLRLLQMTSKKHSRPLKSHTRARKSKAGRAKDGKSRKYDIAPLKATVDKNRKGFAFLIFENKKIQDAFISPREAEGLFHGDRVEVQLTSSGRVQGVKVIEHRFREVVGRFSPFNSRNTRAGFVVYERKRAREEIYVPKVLQAVNPNDWVRVKLQFHNEGPYSVTGEILDVYGQDLPPCADVAMISAEYSLSEGHSKSVEQEAERHRLEIPGKDLENRKDLREIPFITIDGETARDFDDAIFVEKSKTGYILWVAIADVSHYVKEGSQLDQEARSKGTSVYFPERAFHMLPRALSENLCSLRPHEPRLALVAEMKFDQNGKRLSTRIIEAVIESKRRATYNEIQSEWEQHQGDPNWSFSAHFQLFEAMRKMRMKRGSIDFELPEAEVKVEPTGEVISILNRARIGTHRLIEEFMIAANEAVTVWMMERAWPFVYRVHEEPSLQSLEKFQALAATVGVQVFLERLESPKVIAELIRKLEGHPAQSLLNMSLLRSMKQAVYSSTHGIHFGLASEAYTHFTSPIRRYPDLVVHRLIKMALRAQGKKNRTIQDHARGKLEKELAEICEHCSYRERLAADAERESIKVKQVRAMIQRLGDEFEAKVVGMIDSGFFVQLQTPFVEGMVSVDSMTDDFYEFNEERMVFYGRRKRRTFKIGDTVQVKVIRADLDRRQIDFGLIK